MKRDEILIAGRGGQGVVLAGEILGTAATLDGKFATQTSTFGSAQRGIPVYSEIIISDTPIKFTFARKPLFFIAISQQGFDAFYKKVDQNALVLLDPDLVKDIHKSESRFKKYISVCASKTANEMSNPLVVNLVMLGAFIFITNNIVSRKGIEKVIRQRLAKHLIEKNLEAVNRGYLLAKGK